MAWSKNSADWVNLHTHLRDPLWQSTRLALVFFYISSRIISSQQINWNVFIHILNYLCSQDSSHGNILLYSTGDTLITNPGSLEIRACGDISAKWYYLASCASQYTFKMKCPESGIKSMFGLIRNRWVWSSQWFILLVVECIVAMYCGSSEIKCWVSGA